MFQRFFGFRYTEPDSFCYKVIRVGNISNTVQPRYNAIVEVPICVESRILPN